MQNDFVTGCLGTKEAKDILPRVLKTVTAFEQDGIVLFTRDTHESNYLNTQEGRNLPVVHCIRGSEGWEIIPELNEIAKNHLIFDKPAFGSTALAKYIQQLADCEEAVEVSLCGVCTGICVISNAMLIKAFAPEVPLRVIADACACVTPASHQTALEAMKTCQIEVI